MTCSSISFVRESVTRWLRLRNGVNSCNNSLRQYLFTKISRRAWAGGERDGGARDPQTTRALIDAAEGGERRKLIVEFVRQEVAELLGLGVSVDSGRPLSELGLDSLMSVSLVNKLEPVLGVPVPMATLLKGP